LGDSKLFSVNESEEYNTSFEAAVRNGWTPPRGTFAGIRRVSSQTKMNMSDGAVMPDGGLSPCIIKVVGVGGGGCNAVSLHLQMRWHYMLLNPHVQRCY
jgi:cell division protein FtsZ